MSPRPPIDRRAFLHSASFAALVPGAAALLASSAVAAPEGNQDDDKKSTDAVPYVLPPLPYKSNELDSFLSAEILELHHDKHHAGYVKGLNAAQDALAEARTKGDFALVKHWTRQVAFHGSGHLLHTLYWNSMSPQGGGEPTPKVKKWLEAAFGTFDAFKKQFAQTCKDVEGSGWGILAFEPAGNRMIVLGAEVHQQMGVHGAIPLIVCDVWEHAYYLKYQNKRGDYVDKFFDVVNWKFAHEQLKAAIH